MNATQKAISKPFFSSKKNNVQFFLGGGQLNFANPLKMPVLSISGFEFQAHLNKILIFLWLLLGSQLVIAQGGQEICSMPADCGKLSIEMIRLETPTSSCPMDNSGCANLFYQRGYKLYLKYTLPQAPINNPIVALNYQSLSLSVPFRSFATGTSAPGRSQINKAATLGCFANEHAYWNNYNNGNGDKVIFNVDNNYVSIDFYSNPSDLNHPCGIGGTTGNQLVFDFSTRPPLASNTPGVTFATCMGGSPSQPVGRCAYLELFTVIVDAYPEELMRFENANTNTPFIRQYISKDATIVCSANQIPVINSGTFNAFGTSPVAPNPIAFANTTNEGIVLEFTTPMPTTNDPEIKTLDVVLRNKGTTDLEVKYIEFLLDAIVQGDNIKLGFTGDLSSLGNVDLIDGVSKVFQNKIRLAGAISAGGFKKIGTINLGPSSIYSTQWQASLSFITDMAKARIITTAACTNLNVAPLPVQILEQGTPKCTNTDIHFSMDVTNEVCGLYNVKVKIHNTNTSAQYRVAGFSLIWLPLRSGGGSNTDLQVLDPALINGFSDWPWPTTGVSTCQNICGNQNYCIANNVFKYCFETTATNILLAPGATIDMDIPVSANNNVCIGDILVVNASITLFTVVNGQTVLQAPCLPFLAPNTGLPSCASGGDNSIVGTIKTELNQGIEDVNVNITGSSCPTPNSCQPFDMISDIDGNYSACQICFDCNRQKITPVLDLDPLNGVNTYDLILISRHILGLEPLNTPFKLISADANNSGTVTTFDIVALRKLILGTLTSFSQIESMQKSWRFFDQGYIFPNPQNPWILPSGIMFLTEKESITLNATSLPNSQVNFIGTKIGDVDNTVAPHSKKKRPDSSLGFMTNTAAKGGDIITVPVYYQGETVMDGLQFALKFDLNVWELIGPSAGDIAVVPDHFGLSKADQGSIGFSWNTIEGETEAVQPGTLLFNLSFKAKGDIVSAEPLLQIDYAAVSDGAWTHDGTEHHLVAAPVAVSRQQKSHYSVAPEVKAVPNPTTGLSTLFFNTSVAGKIRLVLTDAYGRQLSLRDVTTEAGQQAIVVQELEHRAAGIYHWWLKMPDGTVTKGQIIKI
jgi:hypothetical protein